MVGRLVMMLLAVVLAVAGSVSGVCTHNNDCDPNFCCLVGSNRYSIPSCLPRRGVGAGCTPGRIPSEPTTLYYENDETIEVGEHYVNVCPCQHNLVCVSGTCQR